MGVQRLYNTAGGFAKYLYHQVGSDIIAPNGMVGKIIESIEPLKRDGLPIISNSSNYYLKANSSGDIVQVRVFKDRMPVLDIDFNHEHTNKKSGEFFKKGEIHVHEWYKDTDGKYKRSHIGRYLTAEEKDRYHDFIIHLQNLKTF